MKKNIKLTPEILEELNKRKINQNDTYEEVIWDLLEDSMELSEETKKRIKIAEKEVKEGKIISYKQLKEDLGL
jgi:hypothetical protein